MPLIQGIRNCIHNIFWGDKIFHVYLGPVDMDGQLVVVRIVGETDRMPEHHSLHLRIGPHKHVNKFADKNSVKNLENVIISTES